MKLFPSRTERLLKLRACTCEKGDRTSIEVDAQRASVRLALAVLIACLLVSLMFDGGISGGKSWLGVVVLAMGLIWFLLGVAKKLTDGHSLVCSIRCAFLRVV